MSPHGLKPYAAPQLPRQAATASRLAQAKDNDQALNLKMALPQRDLQFVHHHRLPLDRMAFDD